MVHGRHGRHDRFFPLDNGEAIAREIRGARLLVLDDAATAIPDSATDAVADAMLALEGRSSPGGGRFSRDQTVQDG